MTADPFDEFLTTTRQDAASAYVTGDAAPVTAISTRRNPATFFGPSCGSVTGAEAVIDANEAGVAMFEPGGETRLQVLHFGQDGDLGVLGRLPTRDREGGGARRTGAHEAPDHRSVPLRGRRLETPAPPRRRPRPPTSVDDQAVTTAVRQR
jgi:hypothetical protein